MVSILASLAGWIISKIFGGVKSSRAEKKYAGARKENAELRAENAGLRIVRTLEEEQGRVENEFKEARENEDTDTQFDILRRDFDD